MRGYERREKRGDVGERRGDMGVRGYVRGTRREWIWEERDMR